MAAEGKRGKDDQQKSKDNTEASSLIIEKSTIRVSSYFASTTALVRSRAPICLSAALKSSR